MVNKNKIINTIAITVALAIVAGISTTFLVNYNKKKSENISEEKVTSFSVIGNPESEITNQHTQVDANNEESQTDAEITNPSETVTDKNGNTVPKPTDKQPNKQPDKQPDKQPNNQSGGQNLTPPSNSNVTEFTNKFGFAWDTNSGVFYSTSDPWQRMFGYNALYDQLSPLCILWYDTVRVKFNYGGYDWLVQFWKGQYGLVLLGAEAGVYYKDENSTTDHYICSDDNMRLKIGYTCYYKGDVLFERPYQDTWWLTGFVPGMLDKFADRSPLQMAIRITLKDEEMRDAFVAALKKSGVGFTEGDGTAADTFRVSGNDVYLTWKTDRSKTS